MAGVAQAAGDGERGAEVRIGVALHVPMIVKMRAERELKDCATEWGRW
jgi:hypothetical protein